MRPSLSILLVILALLTNKAFAKTTNNLPIIDTAEACYLIFIHLYTASYSADRNQDTQCVQLEYQRRFSKQELTEATRQMFSELHGTQASIQNDEQLQQFTNAYQDVSKGDRYQYCISSDQGEMSRDGTVVARINGALSRQVFNLWITDIEAGKPSWNFSRCR